MRLYIAEKSSQVKSLKAALKKNNMFNDVSIITLSGHIMQLYDFKDYDASQEDYWVNLVIDKKVPFFPKQLKKRVKAKSSFVSNGKKITSDYKKKFDSIKAKILEADEIILAPDPDNEGATLVLEVVEAYDALDKVKGMINMSKLDISSLSKEVKVIDKLPFMNMYYAGDSRAYFDQIFGINGSIISTVALGSGKLLNIGGVKLPTIRMVVERDLSYEAHKEVFSWTLKGRVSFNGSIFDVDIYLSSMDDTKFDSLDVVEGVKSRVENILEGSINSFKRNDKKQAPPKPYSLTDLQSEVNQKFKLSADDTLKIAQKLYADKKVQSYPRTDCNYYAEGEYSNASIILNNLSSIDDFSELIDAIENISTPLKRIIFNDKKITAHTALTPTLDANNEIYLKLDDLDKKVFNLVVKRYIIQFLDDYEFYESIGDGKFNSEILFKFKDTQTKKIGWKIVTDFKSVTGSIPIMSSGAVVDIVKDSFVITKGVSKPKPRFSEATLLKAMERVHRFFDDEDVKKQLGDNGIGTPATRATILKQLRTAKGKDEPYFKVAKGVITSTDKARKLIEILPKDISSPVLRANMESRLKDILNGTLSKEDYFKEVIDIVTGISDTLLKIGNKPTKRVSKKMDVIDAECPLCTSNLVETDKVFKCSKQKYKDSKQSGCKFSLFKSSKPLGRNLTIKDIDELLAGVVLKGDKGNISLDLDNKYFTKVEWTAGFDDANGEFIETEKTYRKNGKFCFKNAFGKKLTKKEAEMVLDGKEVEIKRTNKEGKDYSVTIWLNEDGKGGFEHCF